MILDRITLSNFGLYAGHQSIDLAPVDWARPVILIGGMNGCGKTTLLDAIHLAFYGSQGQCAGRDRMPYKQYLESMIHRGSDPAEGASIEIAFRRTTEGITRKVVVKRSWRMDPKGLEEFVDVAVDGLPDAVLSEHWSEYIGSYLPVTLAGLFFFDGEQIARMAEDEHAAGLLKTALDSLLGLELVDRLASDLDVLERKQKKQMMSEDDQKRLNELEAALVSAQTAADAAKQEQARLKTTHDRLEKELADLRKRFRDEGGELFLRREQLEADRERVATEISDLEAELRTLAAGPAPLLLLEPSLEEVERQARMEIEAERARLLATAEADRDRQVLKTLRDKKFSQDVLAAVEATLEAHRPQRLADPGQLFLNPSPDLADELRDLRHVILPRTRSLLGDLLLKLRGARERAARFDEQLGAVPTADAIGRLQKSIQDMENRIRETEVSYRMALESVKQRESEVMVKERAWRNALSNAADTTEQEEDRHRIVARIPKVQATLQAFRHRVVTRRIRAFEHLILDSFRQLLRKNRLVTGLKIAPADYHISLTGGDGRALPFQRLSAGERQMLATAILWGLSRSSGRPVPLVIDTPLGRLDSTHRSNLVERYFPAASHQVILLSTDTEIKDQELPILRPAVSREYRLRHDEAHNNVCIENGYFDHHEATR